MQIEIRNKRSKGWFYLDNDYLNGYARLMNPMTTLVYVSLCRHADNNTQECFPSMKLIAEECNISKPTVVKAIKELEDWNIISVERSLRQKDKQAPNIYTLLDKIVWKEKPRVNDVYPASRVNHTTTQSKSDDISRVKEVYHKDTHINYTNIRKAKTSFAGDLASKKKNEDISKVIETFANEIDAKNKNYYGNTTQRKACDFLINTYGFEQVLALIPKLKETNKKSVYQITSPFEMQEKITKVFNDITRQGESSNKLKYYG